MTTKKVVGTGLDDSGRSVFFVFENGMFHKKSGVVALDVFFYTYLL